MWVPKLPCCEACAGSPSTALFDICILLWCMHVLQLAQEGSVAHSDALACTVLTPCHALCLLLLHA